MILSGTEIRRNVELGLITIDPFDGARINPNSYNYLLGDEIIEISPAERPSRITLGDHGAVLRPGSLYLGSTVEQIGSAIFTTSLIGRSSVARLGLFVQVDADLGQLDSVHCWTLELRATQPVRVYPGMEIGQVSFWLTRRPSDSYSGTYAQHNGPRESYLDFDSFRQ